MKIYQVIADSKPKYCIYCPLSHTCKHGVFKEGVEKSGKWISSGVVPGPNCLIVVKEAGNYET